MLYWVGVLVKDKTLKIIFIISTGFTILAIILFILAIIFYPGGFDFLHNTISDIGRVTAHNEEINNLSRGLYICVIFVVGIAVITYYLIAPSFFQKRKITKWLSIIGTALGMVQAVLYIILAFTPLDTKTVAHNRLIYASAPFLYAAIFVYTIVYFLDKDFPKINRYSYLVMDIVAVLLTTTIILGEVFGEPIFSGSRTTGHTIFNFIVLIIYGLQTLGAYIFVKNRMKTYEEKEAIKESIN